MGRRQKIVRVETEPSLFHCTQSSSQPGAVTVEMLCCSRQHAQFQSFRMYCLTVRLNLQEIKGSVSREILETGYFMSCRTGAIFLFPSCAHERGVSGLET